MEGGGEVSAGEEKSWSASTNWVIAEGLSLLDSISFETSADDDDRDAPSSKRGLVLRRPPSDESLPCEVTIYFKEKHELHQIYVRSTARVYEIYHNFNQLNNSTEYLCTVRCGVAAEEVRPASFTGAITESQNNGFETVDIEGTIPHSDSSNSEDGWIEVQVPDSSLQTRKENTPSRDADVYYEATAQISDATPCLSITLRFLSLQTKTHVQIDEIYIYADHVDSSNPDGSADIEEKFGGNPLLAMLFPTFMQLSKSGKNEVQDKAYSDSSGIQKYQYAAEQGSVHKERPVAPEAHFNMVDNILGLQQLKYISNQNGTDQEESSSMAYQRMEPLQKQTEVKPETMQMGSTNIISDQECSTVADHRLKPAQETKCTEKLQSTSSQSGPDQVSLHNHEEKSQSNGGIETMLDELVSRVGRIEALFSRFEEKMIEPLSCIDTRLQRLEQQFDAFAVGHQFCGRGSYSKISAPEFSCDESDSETEEKYNTSCEVKDFGSVIPSLLVSDLSFETTTNICPGLGVKAPDAAKTYEEHVKIDNALESDPNDRSKGKTHSSIDLALASALAAFFTVQPIEVVGDPNEPSDGKRSDLNPSYARDFSEETDGLIMNSNLQSGLELEADDEDSPLPILADFDTVKSDCQNDKFNMSGKLADSAAFDDSSTDNLDLSVSPLKLPSGLTIMAPEFPNDDDSSINSDASDPTFKDYHEDEIFVPNDSGLLSAFTALDPSPVFRASSSSITSLITGVETNHHGNSKISFMVGASSAGANEWYREDHGDDIKGKINFDEILGFVLPKEGLKCEEYKSKKLDCSPEAPGEGSTAMASELNLQQMENIAKLYKCSLPMANATDDGFFVHHMVQTMGVGSNSNDIKKLHDEGLLSDTNPDNNADGDQSLSQCGRDWEESMERATSQGNLLESYKKHVYLADWSREASLAGSVGVDESTEIVIEDTNSLPSVGGSQEYVEIGTENDFEDHKHEVKRFFNFIPSYDDSIVHVKFTLDRTLRSELPLDILLGEAYMPEVHSSDVKDLHDYVGEPYSNVKFDSDKTLTSELPLDILLGETYISEGHDSDGNHVDDHIGELYSLTSQWKDPDSLTMSQLMREVENLSLGDEASGLFCDDLKQPPQSSEASFISLI